MHFGEVPVACADVGWLCKEFLPAAEAALLGGDPSVVVMSTDSHQESEYLVTRVKKHLCDQHPVSARELSLSPMDPTLAWENVFGTPVYCSTLTLASERDVLLVRGGNYLPAWWLKEHGDRLAAYAKGYRMAILLPVARSVAFQTRPVQELLVPSFSSAPDQLRRDFVMWSIQEHISDLRDDPTVNRQAAREELCSIICNHQPGSRAIVEMWIRRFMSECERLDAPSLLHVARDFPVHRLSCFPPEPAPINSRSALQDDFHDALLCLQRANLSFEQIGGQKLFRSYHDLPYPFHSPDPLHWFIGCVSLLSCLYFDAAKRGALSVVAQYRVDDARGDIAAADGSSFLDSLRLLRTFLQHGLSIEDGEDRKTLAKVTEWCTQTLGDGQVIERSTSRICLAKMIGQLREAVDQVTAVVSGFAKWPTAYAITNALRYSSRVVAEHEVTRAIQDVVSRLELDLEPAEVARVHLASIAIDVRNSTCRIDNLDQELARVAEKYCLEASRRSPRIGDWLKSQGLVGKQIGDCHRLLDEAWARNPKMSKEEFMALASKEVARIRTANV